VNISGILTRSQGVDAGALEAAGALCFCVVDASGTGSSGANIARSYRSDSSSGNDNREAASGVCGGTWGDARRLACDFIFGRVGPAGESLLEGAGGAETTPGCGETIGDATAAPCDDVLFVDDLDAFEILCSGSDSGDASALQIFSRILRPSGPNGMVSYKVPIIHLHWINLIIVWFYGVGCTV
jgi:hypothetical protein